MKTVNILLEGDKDVHFLHEFILRRFPAFVREQNPMPSMRVGARVEMRDSSNDVRLVLHKIGGFKCIATHAELLQPKADLQGDFSAVVIFDSDYPEGKDNGGQLPRRAWVKQAVKASSRRIDLADDDLFLFPDNQDDGDLEVLMERMIADTAAHRTFLEVCWQNFDVCIKKHGFNRLSQKLKLNEYSAAFNDKTWTDGGINAAFLDETLWNWNAIALAPLYDFLCRVLCCPSVI